MCDFHGFVFGHDVVELDVVFCACVVSACLLGVLGGRG